MFGFGKKKAAEAVKPKLKKYDPYRQLEPFDNEPRTIELTELANREQDIKYRKARGHNVTKQELIALRDDCAAFDERWRE